MENRKLEKREHYFTENSYVSISVENLNEEKANMVLQAYEELCRTIDRLFREKGPFA